MLILKYQQLILYHKIIVMCEYYYFTILHVLICQRTENLKYLWCMPNLHLTSDLQMTYKGHDKYTPRLLREQSFITSMGWVSEIGMAHYKIFQQAWNLLTLTYKIAILIYLKNLPTPFSPTTLPTSQPSGNKWLLLNVMAIIL